VLDEVGNEIGRVDRRNGPPSPLSFVRPDGSAVPINIMDYNSIFRGTGGQKNMVLLPDAVKMVNEEDHLLFMAVSIMFKMAVYAYGYGGGGGD
jgi:hypothetical protein